MYTVGIWARDGELPDRAVQRIPEVQRIRAEHPAGFAGKALDLLIIAPDAPGWDEAGAVNCRTVLLHGAAGPLARGLSAPCAVSYGTSTRDTLTLSSLEGARACLALQRELVTLEGNVVERQELVLPFPPGTPPLSFLAAAGALLLLGVPPEELDPARG